MKFQSILAVIIIGYSIYYAWMIFSDLFLKKEALPVDKVGEEEEIDVSGESASFHPEIVRKDTRFNRHYKQSGYPEISGPVNTGAIRLEDFLSMAEDYSRDGEFSEIGKQLQEWGANVA